LTSGGGNDVYVVKKACTDGSDVWATSLGGVDGNEYSGKVRVSNSGDIFISGVFGSSTMGLGLGADGEPLTLNNQGGVGSYDVFWVKVGADDGHVLDSQSEGGSGNDIGGAIALVNSSTGTTNTLWQSIVFASPTLTFGGSTYTNDGSFDVLIGKSSNVGGKSGKGVMLHL